MPDEMPGAKLPSPWKDFFEEIDRALEKPLVFSVVSGPLRAVKIDGDGMTTTFNVKGTLPRERLM
jgi:hypothetical protein